MADSSLGEYKVIIGADYSALTASMTAITQAVSQSAQDITSKMSTMTEGIGKSMSEMAATTRTAALQSAEQINSMNSALKSVETAGAANSIKNVGSATESLGPAFQRAASSASGLTGALGKLKSHLEWIGTAAFLGGIVAIPAAIIGVTESTEALNAKIRQNLELSDRYHGNNELLDADMQRLTQTAQTYAVGYGASIEDVQQAMQVLSRRFKDVEIVSYLTSVALTMNRLDQVQLTKASQDLEAVMLQFGLSGEGTKQFLNDFTVAVHTARVTGTDLLDALERSGSAFKGFNMDCRESIAAVAALSTETARAGGTIGNSFKSIAANFDTKKAIEALDAYNIKLYEVNENGTKTMRSGANIFGELQNLFQQLDDEGQRKLALSLAGGKFQVNQLMAFLEDANGNFSKIMNEMKEKSSDAMTQQLLAVSMQTYQVKIAQFKAALQVLAQTIGNQVLPALKKFAVFLTGSAMWLQQHSTAVINVGKGLLILVAGYVAVRTAVGMAAIATGLYNIALAATTGTVALSAAGTWAQSAASAAATIATTAQIAATDGLATAFRALWVAMGPVGWVILGIIALGTAIYEVYTNWSTVGPLLIGIWNGLIDFIYQCCENALKTFPLLGVGLYVVYALFEGTIELIKAQWNGWISFFSSAAQIIYKIIISTCDALPALVQGFKDAISNICGGLFDFSGVQLPEWANQVISYFSQLADKIDALADRIANKIRSILDMAKAATSAADSNATPEEDPFQKAINEQKAMYEQFKAQMDSSMAPVTAPTLPDQIGGGGAGGSSGRHGGSGSSSESGETEYEQQKKAYEAAKTQAEYDTESQGKKFTANDDLYLYNAFLSETPKTDDNKHQETLDYNKGEYERKKKIIDEELELDQAKYDREEAMAKISEDKKKQIENDIAQKKANGETLSPDEEKVYIALQKVNSELAGSAKWYEQRKAAIEAETKLIENQLKVIKERANLERTASAAQKAKENPGINVDAVMGTENKEKKTQQEKVAAKQTYDDNEQETVELVSESAKNLTTQLDLYKQYCNATTSADRAKTEKLMEDNSTDATQLRSTLNAKMAATKEYYNKKNNLDLQSYQQENRYEIAALKAYTSGVEQAMNSILTKTKSFKEAMTSIFSSLWKAVAQQYSSDFATKWTAGLNKLVLGQKKANNEVKSNTTTTTAAETANKTAADTAAITSDNNKTAKEIANANKLKEAQQNASTEAAQTSVTNIGTELVSLLQMAAIMYALSALFGGGSSSSSSTTTRSSSSYYGSGVATTSLPSYDVGTLEVPEDMLAQVHKGETIVPATFAEGARDFISNGGFSGSNNNQQQQFSVPNVSSSQNYKISAMDGASVKRVLSSNAQQTAKGIYNVTRSGAQYNANRWNLA